MIALLKYSTGVPFKRLERLEGQLGMPLPAATQWELMEAAAKGMRPVLDELIRQAAQGGVMHNDDTGMRILQLVREPGDPRTGTFTSGIVSLVGVWIARCAPASTTTRPRTPAADPDVRRLIAQRTQDCGNPTG